MAGSTILIVDDDHLVRWSISERLKAEGHSVLEAATGREALEALPRGVEVVLLDCQLPDVDGFDVLREIRELDREIAVIMLTAEASIDTAVEAMKRGAYHFANKPFNVNDLVPLIDRALETARLRDEVRRLRSATGQPIGLPQIIGASGSITRLRHLVARIAMGPASTVLITGESGTGKDLVAKVIHFSSERASRPFVNITCSALPDQLLESELFGHERGAFTDAHRQKKGLLEVADGGTVFLDEIAEMTPVLQAKLLRFLEEKQFKRVGGPQDIQVDVRIIAATNRDLAAEVERRRFRVDLFYRLNVLQIVTPPLRNHLDDVPLLTEYFVDAFNTEFRKRVCGATPATYAVLQSYGWPGNVRELRNVIERAMLLADGDRLDARDFGTLAPRRSMRAALELPADGVDLEDLERSLVTQALARSHGNQTRAGALLGLNRDQIRYRIEKFKLLLAH
jgi:two-component system, NtrC family, response regulator AtoC